MESVKPFVGGRTHDHDTPEFAADNIARWWRDSGRKSYPEASELLILADSGGSNGARVRTWKFALQAQEYYERGSTQQLGGDEPPPRLSDQSRAAIRQCFVRSIVPGGGGRPSGSLSVDVEQAEASDS